MSALPASVSSSWIPEDDLLLKNVIETSASLEALAKGAVQFSRKFTVRELQDRWRALPYDPVISDQAAACMIEVELSASNLSSTLNKFDNSVETSVLKGNLKALEARIMLRGRGPVTTM
ncbi:microspherule protein 1-like [Hibiscus syriacus]|uniref:microspherule protein 1-like n=1 Tax=Hibiscus syriacus TaxID=106335 RepID=UPI001922F88D|nr:microspherule protein 1-like [Hibiscus syriacus]